MIFFEVPSRVIMWASYVEACKHEFLGLTQGDRSIPKYKATDYDESIHFEDNLRYNLRVLIAVQKERVFVVMVGNAKIFEEVKFTKRMREEGFRFLFISTAYETSQV